MDKSIGKKRKPLSNISNVAKHCQTLHRDVEISVPLSHPQSCRISASESLLEKYYSCADGKAKLFIQQPVDGYALIIQGIYPISNDFDGNIGSTEKKMHAILDHSVFAKKAAFNNICPISSCTNNKIVNQDAISKLAEDNDAVRDYFKRLSVHVDNIPANGPKPCIYIAGKTSQCALEKAIALKLVKKVEDLSNLFGVSLYRIGNRECVVLEGRLHPSAQLMSYDRHNEFNEVMNILNGIGRCCHTAWHQGQQVTPTDMELSIVRATAISQEEVEQRRIAHTFMTKLLYGTKATGVFLSKHVHLRNVPAYCPQVQKLLMQWNKRGQGNKVLVSILSHGTIYLDPLKYENILEDWWHILGTKQEKWFIAFMCDSVAKRLLDADFNVELYHWCKILGVENFVKFMCNSVAKRLMEPLFKYALEFYHRLLDEKQFVTFLCQSTAARLMNCAFRDQLRFWFDLLGKDQFVKVITGSVAKRLLSTEFKARLLYWYTKLGADLFVKFIGNSLAKNLMDAKFSQRLLLWHGNLGDDGRFVTLMSNSITCRLLSDDFNDNMIKWFDILGDDLFVKLMGTGVAPYFTEQTFNENLKVGCENIGAEKVIAILRDLTSEQIKSIKDDTEYTILLGGNKVGVSRPAEIDVLIGRGGFVNNHPGNIQFRQLACELRSKFIVANKAGKGIISVSLVNTLHGSGSRFLQKSTVDDLWYEVHDDVARKKAIHYLGEKRY